MLPVGFGDENPRGGNDNSLLPRIAARSRVDVRSTHGGFQSFAANPGYAKDSTVRTLSRCELKRRGPLLTFIIEGDGFLYKMCRGIVGTLVQAGQGKYTAADIQRMLDERDRRIAGMTAPAHGLVLWKVFY